MGAWWRDLGAFASGGAFASTRALAISRLSRTAAAAGGARGWGRRATAAASTARCGWRGRCQPRPPAAAAAAFAGGTPPRYPPR